MSGMIEQAMQSQQQQGHNMPQGPDMGGEQATAEEQEAYERVVLAAAKVLHDDPTNQQVMQMLETGAQGDPAQALAEVVTVVITQLDEQSGGTIPGEVIIPASAEVLSMASELAESAGLFQADEATLQRAVQMMQANVGEAYGIDPDELQAMIAEIDPGTLESLVAEQSAIAQTGFSNAPGQPAQGAPGIQGGMV